jgi:hypothetical protein
MSLLFIASAIMLQLADIETCKVGYASSNVLNGNGKFEIR